MTKIIYYYQTFIGLQPLLENDIKTTHIIVSSIHFGKDKKNKPYIHLNDLHPDDKQFNNLWVDCQNATDKGIIIMLMMGGAGGAYDVLFNNFETYYPLLKNFILKYKFIKGIDLDIEEGVSLSNVKFLINTLNIDFGKNFIITMAPISNSLSHDYPGLGGFKYKDLLNSKEGKRINWFNVQFYFQYTKEIYDQCVENGYDPTKLIFGMIGVNNNNFDSKLNEMKKVKKQYSNFAGVYIWEYCNSPPNPKKPYLWSQIVYENLKTV